MRLEQEREPFFVARQPIVDARLDLAAYELLFRGKTAAGEDLLGSGTTLTARMLIDGVLVNGLRALTGDTAAYVNFPSSFITGGAALMLTPPSAFVVEILESVEPTDAVRAACSELREAGFRVALDDAVDPLRVAAFGACINVVKVDWPLATEAQVRSIVSVARAWRLQLLAEKIETQAQFDAARRLGFQLFQGYLLGRPAAIRGRSMPGIAGVHLRLLEVTSRPEIELRELEEVVLADPTLTYKVLSFANSAAAAQLRRIRTVREALVLCGQDEIRRAAWVVALSGMARSGPWYVLNETLTRGYFCDAIIERRGGKRVPEAFLAGLLSGIDMLLGVPLEEAIGRLPLPNDLQRAIVHGDGPLGSAVMLAGAYAGARWEEATARAGDLGIGGYALPVLYQVAAGRARELMRQFEPGDGASPTRRSHDAA